MSVSNLSPLGLLLTVMPAANLFRHFCWNQIGAVASAKALNCAAAPPMNVGVAKITAVDGVITSRIPSLAQRPS
ncbi:hypothetical protein D3C71_1022240 [compost metagenome]